MSSLLPSLGPPASSSQEQLSPAAHRILHALNTCTSAADLPRFQDQILLHRLHLNTSITAAFFNTCLSAVSHPRSPSSSASAAPTYSSATLFYGALLISPSPSLPPLLLILSHMLRSSVAPNRYTLPLVFKSLHADLPRGRMLHALSVRAGMLDGLHSTAWVGRRCNFPSN